MTWSWESALFVIVVFEGYSFARVLVTAFARGAWNGVNRKRRREAEAMRLIAKGMR